MIKETWIAKIKEIGCWTEELITFCPFSPISAWSKKLLNFAVKHVDLSWDFGHDVSCMGRRIDVNIEGGLNTRPSYIGKLNLGCSSCSLQPSVLTLALWVVPTVIQSHTGLHDRPIENSTHKLAKLSSLFSAFRKYLKLQNWYHNVLCCLWDRTLLVMFCVLKFYFVDFCGMFTSSPTWRLKMHVLCKVGKNIIFQNKTLL